MAEFQKIMKKENDQFCVRSNHWGNSEKEAFLPVGEAVGLVRVSPHMSQFLVVAVGLFLLQISIFQIRRAMARFLTSPCRLAR